MIDEQIQEAALAVERARHAEASAVALVSHLTQAEANAVALLAEREAQFATELSTITATRDGLEQQLSDAESALGAARQRNALAAADVERLTRREAELTSQHIAEAESFATLERRVADVEAALLHTSDQLSRERTLGAERLATYQQRIEQETAARRRAEVTLASAHKAHADAEKRHESALSDAAVALAERESELAAMLAESAATRGELERRLIAAETALSDAQQQHRSALAVVATQLAEREVQFQAEIASIAGSRNGFEQQLRDVEAKLAQETESRPALEQALTDLRSTAAAAEQRFRGEIDAITESARAEQARLEEQMSGERHNHQIQLTVEQEQHRRAITSAAARLVEREAQFKTELSSITATRDSLLRQLRDVQARLKQESRTREERERSIIELRSAAAVAEQRLRDQIDTIESVRTEQARLEEQMSRDRHDHEIQLTGEQVQHRSALAVAATRLAEREAQFATELASIAGSRDALEQQLQDVEARLTQETESRTALEQALTDLRAAAAAAEQRFRGEIDAITESARAEQGRLEGQMSRERHDHQIQLTDEQQQHRSALAVAATRLAEREALFTTELASIAGSRDALEQQLQDVEAKLTQETESCTALEQALTDLRAAAAAAEQRFRGEIGAITESARAEQARLEGQMSRERHDHEIQLTDEQEQHRSALAVAATRLAEREALFTTELASIAGSRDSLEQQLQDVEARLTQETESRTALEQALTDLRAAAAAAEQRFRGEIDAITESARAEQARLEGQMSRERHDHQIQLTDKQQQHWSALAVAATRLAEREALFTTELASIAGSRDSLEQQLQDVEAKLTQETESRAALEQGLTDLRSAAAAAEQRFRGEIDAITESARTEQARLEDQMSRERHHHEIRLTDEQQQHRSAMAVAATRLAEREAQFKAELASITENARTERARLEEQMASQRALAADRLAERRVEFEAELKRLSEDNANVADRLRASIAERDSRLKEGERVSAALRSRLDVSENENRRQFEETPVPLIRCSRDVGVAGVNRAFAALVGWRAHGELQDQSVAALFESRDDLIWLIERSMNTGKTETVETTCIKRDGARIAVRLSARACASGLVEIAAQDLTVVRVLEDRLREARRMESVGRLASEIAVTCEKLLSDVYRDAQRLLTTMTGAEAPRHSEALLGEVTRVGSFLHQLVAYGQEQAAALAPVDLNRVLRHLEPVLRQVAGDSVTLELRKTSSPVNVDVNAERVERLLVNVASYGRERMPNGGRLQIELSTVVVDGKFIAQHPNVRQGPHALITVIEVPRPAAPDSVSAHDSTTDPRPAPNRPGVDLGALQELISECGGHLWITAEPGGSMVVKMRLPLRAAWEDHGRARHRMGRVTARLLGR